MSIGTKIATGFVLALALIVTLGVASYQNLQRQAEANRSVTHTHQVLENLEGVLSLLKDAETGQRGFILTGKDRYLDPYNAATAAIQRNLDSLGDLAKDNPTQQKSLRQLHTLTDAKLAELQETIQLRRTGGLQAALPRILTDRGKQIMDDIRSVVGRMEEHERHLLDARTEEADASARHTIWTIAIWMPLSLLVLAVAALAIARTARLGVPNEPPATGGRKWASLAVRYGCGRRRCRRGRGVALAVVGVLRPSAHLCHFLSGRHLGGQHWRGRAGDRGHGALGLGGRLLVHPALWAISVFRRRMTPWRWAFSPPPASFFPSWPNASAGHAGPRPSTPPWNNGPRSWRGKTKS